MSKIRSLNSNPELILGSELFRLGFRYRKNVKALPGKPDLVLSKYKTVIFVHGCFWHSHMNCSDGRTPKSNQVYWIPKLIHNTRRDQVHQEKLKELGWKVLIVWECDIKKDLIKVASKLTAIIRN